MISYRRFGKAQYNTAGTITLYLNIQSWPTMQLIRKRLQNWLPDMSMWNSENYFVPKSYFRNTFRWDGEYMLHLPPESKKDIEELLLKPIEKCR